MSGRSIGSIRRSRAAGVLGGNAWQSGGLAPRVGRPANLSVYPSDVWRRTRFLIAGTRRTAQVAMRKTF